MAYPDLKVGVPSLLICIEMAIFALLHQFAFPWQPYAKAAPESKYPIHGSDSPPPFNTLGSKQGGFLGLKAIADAMNPWDLVKGFARGMKWLFVGVKRRENDSSYKNTSFDINNPNNENDMALGSARGDGYKGTEHLPIANEFRRSKFGMSGVDPTKPGEEAAGLIAHAQPNPLNAGGYVPARQRYDAQGQDINPSGQYTAYAESSPERLTSIAPAPRQEADIGMAVSMEPDPYQSRVVREPYVHPPQSDAYLEQLRAERRQKAAQQPKPSEQWANSSRPMRPDEPPPEVHNALWGQRREGQF